MNENSLQIANGNGTIVSTKHTLNISLMSEPDSETSVFKLDYPQPNLTKLQVANTYSSILAAGIMKNPNSENDYPLTIFVGAQEVEIITIKHELE